MIPQFVQLSQDGGWVFYPLLSCAFLLWWFLGARFANVWIPKGSPETILEQPDRFALLGTFAKRAFSFRDQRHQLDIELRMFRSKICMHRAIIQSLIAVAPLLGLLGTVTGMMETFRGLGDSALFSQTGGVAGGVAQALLTTQIGLIIAAPGIIVYRYLEGRTKETLQRGIEFVEWVKR